MWKNTSSFHAKWSNCYCLIVFRINFEKKKKKKKKKKKIKEKLDKLRPRLTKKNVFLLHSNPYSHTLSSTVELINSFVTIVDPS